MRSLLLITFFTFFSASIFAQDDIIKIEGEVISVDLGQSDTAKRERICLTTIRPIDGTLEFVVVEDIYMCHYARKLKSRIGSFVTIKEPKNFFLESDTLLDILQRDYRQANYKILEIE